MSSFSTTAPQKQHRNLTCEDISTKVFLLEGLAWESGGWEEFDLMAAQGITTIKGQDERHQTAPLTAVHATGRSIVDVGEKNMEGRHVGLDFYDLLIEAQWDLSSFEQQGLAWNASFNEWGNQW